MSDLRDLIKKRGSMKGRLTAFITYVNSLDTMTAVLVIELQLRVAKMDQLFAQYDEVQTCIECTVDDKDTVVQYAERQDFENQYYNIMSRAQQLIRGNSPNNNDADDNIDNLSCDSDVLGNQSNVVKHAKRGNCGHGIKLPTIQIPKFGGRYEDWLEFRDTFVSMIHGNNSISDIQKFHYLRACLEGGAAQVIRSLEFSSGNYTIAWDLLCDRYNNNRLLIQNHVRSLFSIEPLKRESSECIRKLIDVVSKNLRSLDVLGVTWDTFVIYLINSKLDPKTSREWEERKPLTDNIKIAEFMSFLKNRADLLETLFMNNKSDKYTNNTERVKGLATSIDPSKSVSCPVCKEDHRIFACNTFRNKSIKERFECVRNLRLCLNCLRGGHQAHACRLGTCTKCSRRHNTLLHDDTNTQGSKTKPPVDTATALSVQVTEQVLLSTAVVYIRDKDDRRHEVRAVLDSGSQASFIAESLIQRLKLKHTDTHISVVGINNSVSRITKRCNTSIESRVSTYSAEVSLLVLPSISSLFKERIHIHKLHLPTHIQLADPQYYSPSSIDMLLGADIFWDLLDQDQIRLGTNKPVLQKTKLGYIVSGPTSGLSHSSAAKQDTLTCNLIQNTQTDIQETLSKFWAIEEPPNNSKYKYSEEENNCEDHFIQNYKRMPDGRFSVAIPLKMSESCLGDSHQRAKHCFLSLERRLQQHPKLQQMYSEFIAEYKELGHMSLLDTTTIHTQAHSEQSLAPQAYYLPHHGVLRENSTTTKLRVVFNASAPTTTGISSNDLQMVGPTIQSDLISILIRFRHYRFVMTGDIEKMYRQVLVHDGNKHLQQILWRDNPSQEIQTYQLNTVTYGTASAPFLAIRCLKQLAIDCKDELISQIISEDFYVDDLVTGSQCKIKLLKFREDICQVLASGKFNLRKIKTNIRDSIDTDSDTYTPLNLGQETTTTLGLGWSSLTDELCFQQQQLSIQNTHTKRSILSTIGQIFDPLGLLSIFIIQAKIILQKLWLQKLTWDEPLPSSILQIWLKFLSGLTPLNSLRIPRCVTCDDPNMIEIHTFCDSSQDAYGACVYIKSASNSHSQLVRLLCAKSKVAPLKTLTIPRLELCGALTAARLTNKVLHAFRLHINRCIFWTDSSIILGWLRTAPNKLKQFVRNRVIEIQELTQDHEWRHVPTNQNPADLITRGVNMSEIESLNFWWTGPLFLQEPESKWPNKQFSQSDSNHDNLPEVVITNIAVSESETIQIIDMSRFSSLIQLKRSFACVLRFIHNCRKKNKNHKITGSLTCSELERSLNMLLILSQRQSFSEYELLKNKHSLPSKNTLLRLSPFMDSKGVIRVGGRLAMSQFSYDTKHPILISCKHPLAKLIFMNEHSRLLHAAPQLLLSSVRQRFWPLGGRNLARLVAHKCTTCTRMRAQTISPVMGQLPSSRVNPGYPFQTTGVDYAGPLLVADRRGRGCRLVKAYIAVFVCFTTKAIHLELVSDLTKETYIAALRRFIARRSKPSVMYSDNGTQFVGAKNEICKLFKTHSSELIEDMAHESIEFKFIPAYAPHFGGLWEAGVKSVKFHLERVLANSHLHFEEVYTTLVQIEAILNSRPLSPISPDPNDLNPLTPGHFLVGRPLTALPSPRIEELNRLKRWQRVEQLRQHFWIRWQKEYVSELQQKTKWRSSRGQLKKGTMVVIKDDALPPMKWNLGRIVEVHLGRDGVGRVADIRTSKGVIRRAFNKICPLNIEDNE